MILLSLQGIQKSFGTNEVLHDASLVLQDGQRMGLVGVNGCGKSTLMKIIAGIETADGGTMTMQKGLKLGYLAQQGQVGEGRTVLEELESVFEPVQRMEQQLRDLEHQMADAHDEASLHRLGSQYDQLTRRFEESNGYGWRSTVQGVLAGLGFRKEQQGQMASLLSGGERTRLCLGRMLLTEPDVLLLDEPTNHLDLKSIAWLEDYLRTYRGAVLLISHDRYFMDHVCDRMCELLLGATECYDGNYSAYMVQRTERFEIRMKAYELQQKEIARQEAIIARYRQFNREKSIRLAESREKRLEKVERLEKPKDESAIHFHFDVRRRTGDDVLMIDDLAKGFSGRTLFEHVKMHLRAGDRVALIGDNGVGKSTLFKCIVGEEKPDCGTIRFGAGVDIGYYDQHQAHLHENKTVLDEVWDDFHRLDQTEVRGALGLFLFTGDDVLMPISTLSGGEKGRVALTKLMLKKDNVLLLDEPTNHLDIESIQWLEEYLRNYNGAVLLISHDRAFLDNVTNRTVELSLGKITDYKVSYSKYVVLRAERRAQQMAAYENQQRMIEKTEEFIEKFRYKPTKSNQVQSRIKQLERLDRLEIEEEDLATLNIKFPPAPRSGQIVAEISEAGMSFGEKHVFSGANFVIEKGDRIALVGRNGEGKTTLARMLIGQLTPTEGSVRLGANVNIGYYAQNQDDLMDGDFTVYDTLDRVAVGDIRTRLRDILGAFLFRGEDIDKKVKVLSGGERARLAMARMMLEPRNLLVLDEPTNHMDMRSKDILKNAIMKYDGTVVVVSHDREFLDGMVEKVYEFRDGGVKEYLGGIYYFLEKRKLESLQEIERRDAPAKMPAKGDEPKPAVSGKLSYEQRKEQEKQLRKAKKVVETIEAELADIEKRIAEYDARFAAATEYNEADYKAYNELKTRYDHQMHEWEKASYELEIIENE